MNSLLKDIDTRLFLGKNKYGHGVRINDDMADYTVSHQNSFLEMQCEEILDGIIYTTSSYLRWISDTYGIEFEKGLDNNKQIKEVVSVGVAFNDEISLKYKNLLDNMIKVYENTKELQKHVVI